MRGTWNAKKFSVMFEILGHNFKSLVYARLMKIMDSRSSDDFHWSTQD